MRLDTKPEGLSRDHVSKHQSGAVAFYARLGNKSNAAKAIILQSGVYGGGTAMEERSSLSQV